MSVSAETSDGIDDEDFATALQALDTATRDLEAAKRAIVRAKDELAVTLFLAARPYRAEGASLPLGSLRTLYWERPEVRVRDIARAFGVRLGELTELVGPRSEPGICTDCDTDTEVARRSRTHRPVARCPPCVEERRRRDRLRREHEQHEPWGGSEPGWGDSAPGWDHGEYRDAGSWSWIFADEPPVGTSPAYPPPPRP